MADAGLRHDRADGQEAEAETGQGADELAVLVESRRQPDRTGEIDAGELRAQPRIVDLQPLDRGQCPPRRARAQCELPDRMAAIG
jgi:hypothetical protein